MSDKKRSTLLSFAILIGYYSSLMFVGMVITYLITMIWSLDVTTESGLLVVAVVFFVYTAIDLTLLYLSKPSPATLALVIAISPIVIGAKYLENVNLVDIGPNMTKRIAEYVFLKRVVGNI